MKEILGERTSVLADFATVHVGAAVIAVRRASAARPGVARARAWRRAAEQFRKAQGELVKAELHALEQARLAGRTA